MNPTQPPPTRRRSSPRSITGWVLLGHALALLLMAAVGWVAPPSDPPDPFVLRMVADAPAPPPPPDPFAEAIHAPAQPPIAPPPEPPADPTPQENPQPEPQPEPEPEPEPERRPEPRRINIDQFRQIHGQPADPPARDPRPSPTRPRRPPDLDVDQTIRELQQMAEESGQPLTRNEVLAQAQDRAVDRYMARLKARLDAAFTREGLPTGLRAQVRFTVLADGRIQWGGFISPSGHSRFDAAVREAFRRVAPLGPPPDNRTHRRTIAFESR